MQDTECYVASTSEGKSEELGKTERVREATGEISSSSGVLGDMKCVAGSGTETYQTPKPALTFLTVKQTAGRHKAFTEASLRHLIFKASPKHGVGKWDLATRGFARVVYRVPGQQKVLLCEEYLLEWLQSRT